MKIIVLSDLHTGSKAIAEEFNTDSNSLHAVKKNYLKDFEKFIKTEEIKADYLFITGDISDRATYKEFELAEKRIKKCAEILSVDASNVYFVPGNHDSNWGLEEFSTEQGEPEEAIILNKYKYLRDNLFFKSILDRAEFGDFYKEPYFVYWSDEKVNIFGLNSSVFDTFDKKPHHGGVRNEELAVFDTFLKEKDIQGSKKCNIILIHHHPIQHSDLPFEEADLSILQNSAQLMELLAKHSFDFIIHGHKHIPKLEKFINGYEHPINVVCAGSFSAVLDIKYFQGIPNTFHLIDVNHMCEEDKIPKGNLYSYSHFTGQGWGQDFPYKFSGKEVFGSRLGKVSLEKLLTNFISESFANTDNLKFTEITKEHPDLLYVQKKLFEQVLDTIKKTIDFGVYWPTDTPELFILIKGVS